MTLDAANATRRQQRDARDSDRAVTLTEYLRATGRPASAREAMLVCGLHTYAQLRRVCRAHGILTGVDGVRLPPDAAEGR